MRKKRSSQCRFNSIDLLHEIHEVLFGCSQWLDAHPQFVDWVHEDLRTEAVHDTGRKALSSESVVRIAILRQYLQVDYDYLSFALMETKLFQIFCRLERNQRPRKSSLQSLVSQITATTWEKINRAQLMTAKVEKIERGRTVAFDSTVINANIKDPYDSDLLADSIRAMCRLLKTGLSFSKRALYSFTHHNRAIKKAAVACSYARSKEKQKQYYKKLLKLTKSTQNTLLQAVCKVTKYYQTKYCEIASSVVEWLTDIEQLIPLVDAVVSQTERRVFHGEKVPASEKIISIFEPHADIIVKDRRIVQYGHKLNLSRGKSGLILDLVIEKGNPADAVRFIPMIKRHIEIYGYAPRQTSVDGGFASKANLKEAKSLGVKDAAFHKKCGLEAEDMAKSLWVYKRLRRFRAGIEAGISWLKRCFGLSRCYCKGSERFNSWCWSAVVTCNLVILARHSIPT